MSEENDDLLRRARLGIEAEALLGHELGQYIIAKSEREIEEGYQGLAEVNPEDPKAVRALQHKIAVARAIPVWLMQAIHDGQEAERQIHEEDQTGNG